MNKAKIIGGGILFLFVAAALIGPLLAEFAPFAVDGGRFDTPSATHWLGTNALGQDMYSELVYGMRTTLLIGLAVASLSTLLSGTLGLLAGYSKRLDAVLNAVANMLLTLPSLLLVLIVASFTGGSSWQLIFTLGLLTWPAYMRLIRASVLSLKEREFVKAARLYRGGTFYVLRKHLLPFLGPLLRTKFIVMFKSAVEMEASLSFLGIGNPSTPSLGKMLQAAFANNATWMSSVWEWTVLPPALAILFATVALALLGETGEKAVHTALKPFRRLKLRPAPAATAPAGMEAAVEARNLGVSYHDSTIVHPASFSVASGDIVAIVGESGSGKTTLARTLYGLVPEVSVQGEAFVAGKRLYGSGARDMLGRWSDAAFIFQDPRSSFDPLMTIGRQLAEAVHGGISARAKREAAALALREVQLGERVLRQYPHELSGGMLSRALIALALINKPGVLIADEPTGALDPMVKREIMDLLVRKAREQRMTLLLITHDWKAASHYAERIMVMQNGCLLEHEDKEQWLSSAPA